MALFITTLSFSFFFFQPAVTHLPASPLTWGLHRIKALISLPRFSLFLIPLILLLGFEHYRYGQWCARKNLLVHRDKLNFLNIGSYLLPNFLEELFFRGALLLILSSYGMRSALIAVPVQAILWGASHLAGQELNEKNTKRVLMIRLVFNPIHGIIYGFVTIISGGILLPCALHLLENMHAMSRFYFFKTKFRCASCT
jgi:membrane protease YdiL (CAAX protease family)